jgi:hypothetical protein
MEFWTSKRPKKHIQGFYDENSDDDASSGPGSSACRSSNAGICDSSHQSSSSSDASSGEEFDFGEDQDKTPTAKTIMKKRKLSVTPRSKKSKYL